MRNKLLAQAIARAVMGHAAKPEKPLTRCAATHDGDCTHAQCPQLLDGEPAKTGRHCPLDNETETEIQWEDRQW